MQGIYTVKVMIRTLKLETKCHGKSMVFTSGNLSHMDIDIL